MNKIAVKTFWFFVNPIRKIYWFVFRPKTKGVKCLVINNKKILLVKLNYAHKKWSIPGGGVKKKESFIDAAKREVLEEAGISLDNVVFKYKFESKKEYKRDTVGVCVAVYNNREKFNLDNIEISKAGWFDIKNLPGNRAPNVDKILKDLKIT